MKEQIISHTTAKLARKKGFDELVTQVYRNEGNLSDCHYATVHNSDIDDGCDATACTQALLQKWLREKHKMDVEAYSNASGYHWTLNKAFNTNWFSGGTHITDSNMSGPNNAGGWNTYEEAFEAGLIAALNRIK